jgi:hypothetical protein
MLIYASAVKAESSGEVRTGAVWDIGKRRLGTTRVSVVEEAVQHLIEGPVAADCDDPIVPSTQSLPGKGHGVEGPLCAGKIHFAEDALDPLPPVRPQMARAPCSGVGIDNEKRSFVRQRGANPRSKRFVYHNRKVNE